MKIFRYVYAGWLLLCFCLPFLIILPFFHFFGLREKWHVYAAYLNKIWAQIFFWMAFIPYKIRYKEKLEKQPYVYCSNHTSWIDTVTMGIIVKGDHVFIGKASLSKLPLFGPVFKKFNISVDREDRVSAFKAVKASFTALDKGQSVVFYPEGGIKGTPPILNNFKDGPFVVAIQKQVPLVPVSILYNWKILDKTFLPRWHRGEAIVHPPIDTTGLTMEDLPNLKQKTRELISQELPMPTELVYESK